VRLLSASIGCLLLAACAGTPPPPVKFAPVVVPSAWSEGAGTATATATGAGAAWPGLFDDPILGSLMTRAAAANLDVSLARARVREARAQAGLVAAAGQPSLKVAGSIARERDSENAPRPVLVNRAGEIESSSRFDSLYQAGFDSSWEIDVFGARAHESAAARADVDALALGGGAMLATVCAEVARNYVALRAAQQHLVRARADLDAQDDMLVLARARRVGGYASEADVANAAARGARMAAQVPAYELEAKRALHRIAVLLGQAPGALTGELREPGPIPHARAGLAIGLPSELLRRRPDIARAERLVAAATARREAAIADLFPRVSLVGSAGLASVSASELFSGASLFARIGPTITWPILRRGQVTATIEVRGAQQEQALVVYRQAILNAFEEVENALAAIDAAGKREGALAVLVRESELALELATARYRGGMADFRAVLDARHGLALARGELAGSEAELATAAIALFKSAGGDWNAVPVQAGD
jgi:multidrug efflux system outer membrane protein